MKILYEAMTCRRDLQQACNSLARDVSKWDKNGDIKLNKLVCYIKATTRHCLQGWIGDPVSVFRLVCYVDADFASGWGTEDGRNPDSVKSRTGYIVELMGCSVIWCSNLQLSTATSTVEAEHTALSMALRAAIPLLEMTQASTSGLKHLAAQN